MSVHPCGCDGHGQVHHGEGALHWVTLCRDPGCRERRDAAFMGVDTRAPWDFSVPPKNGEDAHPNLPTDDGRLLGVQLARLTDIEEARLREKFPRMHRRCGDCAFRAGTDPNGCPETLMDAVKALVENVPFYCHKAFTPEGAPKLLCAGYAILIGSKSDV